MELVGGAAGVLQAQLGVQVMQLLVTTQQEAPHLCLCRLSCLQSSMRCIANSASAQELSNLFGELLEWSSPRMVPT